MRFPDDQVPYEEKQRCEIDAWKAEVPNVVSRALNWALSPLAWAVQKIIPKRAIQGALSASNAVGRQLAVREKILQRATVDKIEALRGHSLQSCDELADWVHNWAIGIATTEGAATGAAGIFAAPVEHTYAHYTLPRHDTQYWPLLRISSEYRRRQSVRPRDSLCCRSELNRGENGGFSFS